jgi:endonuclease/exonuclease/phosphatase family metal-dependent hydrolase
MKGALTRFLRENEYDVVCLEEAVWSEQKPLQLAHFFDTVDNLKEAGGFEYEVRQSDWGARFTDSSAIMEQGNVILSHIPIVSSEVIPIHGIYSNQREWGEDWEAQVKEQCWDAVKVKLENGLTVVAHHGYWDRDPLGDEVSAECARKVADAVRNESGPVVICADMNLISESPAMRELDFLTDLTAETGTKQTLMNLKFVKDVACDHVWISKNIKWSNFEVHKELVSDHAAVSVEIEF